MITVQIDDFNTSEPFVSAFENLMSGTRDSVRVSAYALLSVSDADTIGRLRKEWGVTIGVHGWDHFWEHRYRYWQARHLLEVAASWGCFDREFVMPWNRMPGVGFMKALRESEFVYVSPYRLQCMVAGLFGCRVRHTVPDYLLHPPDLLLGSEQIDELMETIGESI